MTARRPPLRHLPARPRRPDDWASDHERAMVDLADRLLAPLDAAEAAWLEGHLATCPVCRGIGVEYERGRRLLRSLPPVEPPPGLEARIRAALAAERASPRRHRRRASPTVATALAATLVVALVAGTSYLVGLGGLPGAAPPGSGPAATPLAVAAAVAWVAPGPEGTYALTVAQVRRVCPPGAQVDCAPVRATPAVVLTLQRPPVAVLGSPTGDHLVVLDAGVTAGGGSVYAVALPFPVPSPVPSPEPSTAGGGELNGLPGGSGSAAGTPGPRPAASGVGQGTPSPSRTSGGGGRTLPVASGAEASPTAPAPAPLQGGSPSAPEPTSAGPGEGGGGEGAAPALPTSGPASPAPSAPPASPLPVAIVSPAVPGPTASGGTASTSASAGAATGPELPAASPVTSPAGPSPAGAATPAPSPSPSEAVVVATPILEDVVVVGDAGAYAPSGRWFAFSARPADGHHGPDVYLWQAGWPAARPLTSDHRTVFAGWLGETILASRIGGTGDGWGEGSATGDGVPRGASQAPEASRVPAEGETSPATDEAAEPAPDLSAGPTSPSPAMVAPAASLDARAEGELTPVTVAIDPQTGATTVLPGSAGLWRPVVDPTGRLAVVWQGSLRLDPATGEALPDQGSLVVRTWSWPMGSAAEGCPSPTPEPTLAPSSSARAAGRSSAAIRPSSMVPEPSRSTSPGRSSDASPEPSSGPVGGCPSASPGATGEVGPSAGPASAGPASAEPTSVASAHQPTAAASLPLPSSTGRLQRGEHPIASSSPVSSSSPAASAATSVSPAASPPVAGPSPSPIALPATLVTTPFDAAPAAWQVGWDETGDHLAIWVADAADPSFGRLSFYAVQRAGDQVSLLPVIVGVPALPGFSVGGGRLAWVTPPGEGGEGSHLAVLAWVGPWAGQVVSEPAVGETPLVVVR